MTQYRIMLKRPGSKRFTQGSATISSLEIAKARAKVAVGNTGWESRVEERRVVIERGPWKAVL